MKRLALALALLASACWVPVERGRQMEARIQRLEGESELSTRQLDEQRAVVRQRVAAVDAKIAEVQKKLDELNATAHRSGADLAVQQDRLQEEVARLRGLIEEATHEFEGLQQQLKDQKDETDARFAALKGAGALDEYEAKKKLQELKLPTDKGEFFALAQAEEGKGERAVARELYDQFARKWPNDPRAADAHFRIGEILFGDKHYREAILEYGKVAQDFPRSDKAPDALLRTGESMLNLDLRDDARGLFQEVVKRYPHTTAAQRARARLSELSPAPKKR
ncbi:MAG TPA: tol-pal system protein YbgF, partial [Anaeromyxobacteraceae bacterium]|nr:tol-pal system protein YbgF [Anaeromyxobacteraceae bacterium]